MSEYQTIALEVRDHRAQIALDRPESLNGITTTMLRELHDCLGRVADNEAVRVVKLTGNGRAFCVGADLNAYTNGEPHEAERRTHFHISSMLHEMPKVTVAAINGACAGAGFGWACACDLRYAVAGSAFNTAFLDVGLSGDMAGPWLLPRIVGAAKARELYFAPTKFRAEEALQIGLLAGVFNAETFHDDVDAIIERVAASAPLALAEMKRNFVNAETLSLRDYIDIETDRHLRTGASDDCQEAFKAFVEKRDPVFKGR
jgi:2-(1,2-epoxy-1,2-dihydrophenyl)acetyl-CoA isomerase